MIRKLTRQDASAYKKLRLLALTTDPDAYFATYDEEERRDEWSMASEISAHKEPFGYYGFFNEKNALLAYVQITPAFFAKTKHTADIYNLYVHPEARGNGVATKLLQYELSQIRAHGMIEILYLSVMRSNQAAIQLYTKLGFTEIGTKKRSVKLDTKYEDEVLMEVDL